MIENYVQSGFFFLVLFSILTTLYFSSIVHAPGLSSTVSFQANSLRHPLSTGYAEKGPCFSTSGVSGQPLPSTPLSVYAGYCYVWSHKYVNIYIYIYIYIIIIAKWQQGSPSLSPPNIRSYQPTILVRPLADIQCSHRTDIHGAFNKFPYCFVLAFKIVVDSWQFSMLLLYILWDDWLIFMISRSNEHLQQELEYTLLWMVNIKIAIWHFRRMICNKILF